MMEESLGGAGAGDRLPEHSESRAARRHRPAGGVGRAARLRRDGGIWPAAPHAAAASAAPAPDRDARVPVAGHGATPPERVVREMTLMGHAGGSAWHVA